MQLRHVALVALSFACTPTLCEDVAVLPGGDVSLLDSDGLDLATFEAMRDDDLASAQEAFSELIRRDSDDAFAAMWLGMIAVRRSDLQSAELAFAHAVKHVDSRMWVEDEAEGFSLGAKRAALQLSLRRVRERIGNVEAGPSQTQRGGAADGERLLRVEPIERVAHQELGQSAFEERYADPGVPVIITGFGSLSPEPWSVQHLRAKCGHLVEPRVVEHDPRSATWAGMHLKRDPPKTFAEYLDQLTASAEAEAEDETEAPGMVFDWGLRNDGGCRALLDSLGVPSYFTSTLVAAYGPSVFVQPNGTRCGLHFDTGSTHFWQFVWSGRKRWRVWRAEDWPRLFEFAAWRRAFFRDARCSGLFGADAQAAAWCDDGFGAVLADGFDDAALERLAAQHRDGAPLRFYEATLRPGEMIFVPARAPHQVLNVGGAPSIALSMNYVDFTNLQAREHWHLENADLHPKFRARLNKSGAVVVGSSTRWYERFRMPVMNAEFRRLSAVVQHVAVQPQRPDEAFLEPWEELARRPWNLQLAAAT